MFLDLGLRLLHLLDRCRLPLHAALPMTLVTRLAKLRALHVILSRVFCALPVLFQHEPFIVLGHSDSLLIPHVGVRPAVLIVMAGARTTECLTAGLLRIFILC